jgi:hypothetical protein
VKFAYGTNDRAYFAFNNHRTISAVDFAAFSCIPADAGASAAGWFVLEIPAARLETWQGDLLAILQTVSRNDGVEYYEPLFKSESPLIPTDPDGPTKFNRLELEEYPYGYSGGGIVTSRERREAAAEPAEVSAAAAAIALTDTFTYIPSPYCVGSPLEVLQSIARCHKGHTQANRPAAKAYEALAGIIGKDGVLYTLDLETHTIDVCAEQHRDISVTLPLSPNSTPHMWLMLHCEPEMCLPLFKQIYTDLCKSQRFSAPEGRSADFAVYDAEQAHYTPYKSCEGTIFYIPTAHGPYSHILTLPPIFDGYIG